MKRETKLKILLIFKTFIAIAFGFNFLLSAGYMYYNGWNQGLIYMNIIFALLFGYSLYSIKITFYKI